VKQSALQLRHRLLSVDFDIFFAAATGDCEHYANTNRDNDSNQGPCRPNPGKDIQFPESGENAADQDNVTNKKNTCPFHDKPPDVIR
jgi:hypothetical protein